VGDKAGRQRTQPGVAAACGCHALRVTAAQHAHRYDHAQFSRLGMRSMHARHHEAQCSRPSVAQHSMAQRSMA